MNDLSEEFLDVVNGAASFPPEAALAIAVLLLLIGCSAFISGSEIAFFSVKGQDMEALKEESHSSDKSILHLLEKPRTLLATILITNNMVNIAIIIVATYIVSLVFYNPESILAFILEVIGVAFLLVLFGEVLPKVYAAHNHIRFARIMARPLLLLRRIFQPVASFMVKHSASFERRIENRKKSEVSAQDLKEAIEITSDSTTTFEEKRILKGLVRFGNISVRQIMRPRTDMVAFEINTSYSELVKLIQSNFYSRIPVYRENLDDVKGILYIKDLLPHIHEGGDYPWQNILRPAYFVPETKKIDDLLEEFQSKKVHMAIVVDEYGGTSGIVTMEDILEEIVGEIGDEFDEDELFYFKVDSNTFVVDGKTPLNDVTRIVGVDDEYFEEFKGEAETLGGLLMELQGGIPEIGHSFVIGELKLKVEASDRKRVRRVRVSGIEKEEPNHSTGRQ